eukprot:6212307-Pleurochrysis_carterae.AAC.2
MLPGIRPYALRLAQGSFSSTIVRLVEVCSGTSSEYLLIGWRVLRAVTSISAKLRVIDSTTRNDTSYIFQALQEAN